MKVLYLSSVTSDTLFSELFNKKQTTGYVGQKYHGLFIKGLESHLASGDITVLSQPPTNIACIRFPEKQGNTKFVYIPIVPIPVLKQFIAICYSFLYVLYWCIRYIGQKKIVVCSIMRIYQFVPILFLTYLFFCKKIAIVCDIPWMTMTQTRLSAPSIKQRTVMQLSKKLCSIFDAYVFLTEAMDKVINIHNKPYIVIEGFCDIDMANKPNELSDKYDKLVIIYAGGLNVKYGIGTLVQAIQNLSCNGGELWLYGQGDMNETLQSDNRIKFLGPRSNEEVVNAELKATLLINPRPTDGEYTRYSFPSKTLEYMVSGTYTITTKLAGIPSEYFDYCGTIEEESPKGIQKAIEDALLLGREELHRRGLKAREFVLTNKNNIKQTKQVVDLMQSL